MVNSYTSLAQIQSDLSAAKISVSSLVESYLTAISKNKNLNAFLEVFADESLVNAKLLDEKIKTGKQGKLFYAWVCFY